MNTKKSHPRLRIALAVILAVVLICAAAFAVYVNIYYHAEPAAVQAMAADSAVSVYELRDGVTVFAPEEPSAGFIFYPGGKVEHTAYAPLLRACAERGVLCVLIRMPFNLAVFHINGASGIPEQFTDVEHWYLGGHSLGGAMAASYAADHADELDGLVLLAAYSTRDLTGSGLAVLSVCGSEDGVLDLAKYEQYRSNLPAGTSEVVIDGGCHAGFGRYGAQGGDGTPTISSDEQINRTAEEIAQIILRQAEGGASMKQLKEIDLKLAGVLLEAIERREFRVTYKEVAERLPPRLGRTVNPHYELAYPLGAVSSLCHELGFPLISAMVRYSDAKSANAVGEGFYPLACELKPEYKGRDPAEVWKAELDRIRKCQEWGRLRDYLDGVQVEASAKITGTIISTNPFTEWMGRNTELSESSISKYYRAIGTISREMLERGIISKQLQNMNAFELDIAISVILNHPDFIEKNTRGNHMYSNALKQYRYFMNATYEERDPPEYINTITNDTMIPETERTAIIQSRVGQGTFRESLMDKYDGRCIMTGIDHPKLLVASHIKPWAVSTNEERLSVNNGLLLSATYDRLFDCGLITFDKTGRIYLSRFIGDENVKRLYLETDRQYDLRLDGCMGEYLEYHRDVLFVR